MSRQHKEAEIYMDFCIQVEKIFPDAGKLLWMYMGSNNIPHPVALTYVQHVSFKFNWITYDNNQSVERCWLISYFGLDDTKRPCDFQNEPSELKATSEDIIYPVT